MKGNKFGYYSNMYLNAGGITVNRDECTLHLQPTITSNTPPSARVEWNKWKWAGNSSEWALL